MSLVGQAIFLKNFSKITLEIVKIVPDTFFVSGKGLFGPITFWNQKSLT